MITRKVAALRRIALLDLVVAVLVALLVALALAPALARLQRSSGEAQCQSNLRRWSQAMALYVADNHGWYPTNRVASGTIVGAVTNKVSLTPDGQTDADGNPKRFASGPNWVEALYPYLWSAATKTGVDWKSFRVCPKATTRTTSGAGGPSSTSYMTYVFNINLVEQPSSLAQAPNTLMMLRELDCHVNSILRPINMSPDPSSPPICAFLTNYDSILAPVVPTTGKIHDAGSYIAFADGHVRYFTIDYYSKHPEYDAVDQRWYNYLTTGSPAVYKTIAITP